MQSLNEFKAEDEVPPQDIPWLDQGHFLLASLKSALQIMEQGSGRLTVSSNQVQVQVVGCHLGLPALQLVHGSLIEEEGRCTCGYPFKRFSNVAPDCLSPFTTAMEKTARHL